MLADRSRQQIFKFDSIMLILNTRKYQLVMLVSTVIYSAVYMFAVGIISYYPGFTPLKVSTPIVGANSLGVMVIPGSYIFIFAFYSAIIFLTVSSLLIGLSVALMVYSRDLSKTCGHCEINTIKSGAILTILPSFLTSFSCCGGGLIAFVIGPVAFSSLALYSNYMAPLTIAALAAGILIILTRIDQLKKTIISNDHCSVQVRSRV